MRGVFLFLVMPPSSTQTHELALPPSSTPIPRRVIGRTSYEGWIQLKQQEVSCSAGSGRDDFVSCVRRIHALQKSYTKKEFWFKNRVRHFSFTREGKA